MTYYENSQNRKKKRKLSKAKCLLALLFCFLIVFASAQLFSFIGKLGVKNAEQTAGTPSVPTMTQKQEVLPGKQDETSLNGKVKATAAPHDYSVLIRKSEHKIYLLDHGQKVAVWGCAIGLGGAGQKQKTGDNLTPNGSFFIEEIDDASSWTHDFKDGKGEIKGAYGPFFLSLDTNSVSKGKWDGIGIHGTHDPNSIGTNASEGCVRMHNNELRELKKYVQVKTRVVIEE